MKRLDYPDMKEAPSSARISGMGGPWHMPLFNEVGGDSVGDGGGGDGSGGDGGGGDGGGGGGGDEGLSGVSDIRGVGAAGDSGRGVGSSSSG